MRLPTALALLVLAPAACDRQRTARLVDGPAEFSRAGHLARHGVPPSASVGPNGMRATIAPSFGDYWFVVDFVPRPANCYLLLDQDPDRAPPPSRSCGPIEVRYAIIGAEGRASGTRHYRFLVPPEDFREAGSLFNRLARRWRGAENQALDGTMIAVEQYQDGRLRSITTNDDAMTAPDNPAAMFLLAVHRLLLSYAPTGTVPRAYSFTVTRHPDVWPCQGDEFATPDPDGFGIGEDACARHLARHRAAPAAPPAR